MKRRALLAALPGALAAGAFGPGAAEAASRTLRVFATRSGTAAFDNIGEPGNPFATAFIEGLAARPSTARALLDRVRARTLEITQGQQEPVWSGAAPGAPFTQGRRTALLLMFSAYKGQPAPEPLPGAAADAARVSAALRNAGFAVDTALDPDSAGVRAALARFSRAARAADTSLLYVTGHGVEVDGAQYVLPLDFNVDRGEAALSTAWTFDALARAASGRQAGVAIWAGCRDNPFGWRTLA